MKRIYFVAILLACNLFYCWPQIPANGLVSYFPFSGSFGDVKGNAVVTEVSGAILASDRFGIDSNAVLFDGMDDYIEIGNFNELNPMNCISFSLWAQASVNTSNCMLMLYPDDNSDRCVACAQYKGSIYWDYGNIHSEGRMQISLIGFDTLWHHYVYQIDASQQIKQVFMDGDLLQSQTNSETLENIDRSLWIGGGTDANPSNIWFHGRIDELRIYDRLLAPNEVSLLYNEPGCFEYHVIYDTVTVYDTLPVYDSMHVTIYDTVTVFDTLQVYDSMYVTIYDTVFETIYDSVAISDTLVFEAVFTGIDSKQYTSQLKVYPTPARDKIHIETGIYYEQMAGHSIMILDSRGAIVFLTAVNQPWFEIDVRELGAPGLYILQLVHSSSGIIARKKILLE